MKIITLTPEFLAAHDAFSSWRDWRPMATLPAYQTDGISVIHVGEETAALLPQSRAILKFDLINRPRVSLVEDIAKRVPYRLPPPDTRETCIACRGDGVRVCDLGEDHDCRECDSVGKIGPSPPKGESGYRDYHSADGRLCRVADWMAAHLLEGLTPVRLDTGADVDPVAGVDESGAIVAIVMGMAP